MRLRNSIFITLTAITSLLGVAACGGGGGSSSYSAPASSSSSGGGNGYTQNVFLPESTFAAKCASPRSGTDPFLKSAYPDTQGTSVDENNWLRSWTNDLYLWFD